MNLPPKYRDLILAGLEPGETYRRCLLAIAEDGLVMDYGLTETVVYATEIRYALDVIQHGRPNRLWNFGDIDGRSDAQLCAVLDEIPEIDLALAGSGPYPITALLVAERYPAARSITCIDNSIVGYLLGQAVIGKLGFDIASVFAGALDVDYRPFSIVVIAAMVRGKNEIAEKILRTSDAIVVVRGETRVTHERVVQVQATFRDDGSMAV
jgi:hypothetical protein